MRLVKILKSIISCLIIFYIILIFDENSPHESIEPNAREYVEAMAMAMAIYSNIAI